MDLETNITLLMSEMETNVTLPIEQIYSAFNLNISRITNMTIGAATPKKLFSLYDAYRLKEKEKLILYKSGAYVLGTLIILSNLTVVISSGLILKKGQRPKSTYLLLGNVSLADTIIGISLIFGTLLMESTISSNVICTLEIGMIVCPTMVSIFSVGFIAIDRYIYIIHGLYYQQWINTTRVRIGIIIIWLLGLILGFMPVTGWINQELVNTRCIYTSIFPGVLILINSILSVIPIVLVAIFYSIILHRALKNVTKIRTSVNLVKNVESSTEQNKLRIYRRNSKIPYAYFVKIPNKDNIIGIRRCASMSVLLEHKKIKRDSLSVKSKSMETLNYHVAIPYNKNSDAPNEKKYEDYNESKLSIWIVDSEYNTRLGANASTGSISCESATQERKTKKFKEPSKLRAISIVMLTSGSFMVTWVPFFIVVVFYVFCVDKLNNSKCLELKALLDGPLAGLAYVNSLLNPLIYAWWHRGFKSAVRNYLKKCFLNKRPSF